MIEDIDSCILITHKRFYAKYRYKLCLTDLQLDGKASADELNDC